jgi:hypothetical protein
LGFLTYPANIGDPGLQPASIMFSFYERESYKKSAPADIIHLYMPDQVSQPSTMSWDAEAFGMIGSMLTGGKQTGVIDGAKEVAGKAYNTAKANITTAIINKMGGNVSAEAVMGETQGRIPNPYITMIFKGVDFRKFQMEFKFAPFSEKDCDVIDSIIKTFRANSLPPGSGANKGPSFLGYPMEVELKYLWMGKDNKWLHKFKRSVVTGVDVNYAAAGIFSTQRNGFPSNIIVSLSFSEVEIVLRGDVLGGEGTEGGY